MYLYEKNKDKVDVYELKEVRDKLFDFRRKEMEKLNKHEILYRALSNEAHRINSFLECFPLTEDKLITKENRFFIHKRGIKLENVNYFYENAIIIDGLIYQICNGRYNFVKNIGKLYDNCGELKKYFIFASSCAEINKRNIFKIDGEFYKYELKNIVNIPESIYLLNLLLNEELEELLDKNIDEQLSLYDFNNVPINSLDIETVNFTKPNIASLTNDGLEQSQIILKKVRQINK